MSQLQEWILCEENDSANCKSFANLEKLIIKDCPKLQSITTCKPTHKIFKSLDQLKVEKCPNLKTSNLLAISNFREFHMRNEEQRVFSEQLPSAMYSLFVGESRIYFPSSEERNPRLEGNEEIHFLFKALDFEDIEISGNHLLQSIPLEVPHKLKTLHVKMCHNLTSLSASEEPLDQPLLLLASLKISNCLGLMYFPRGGILAPNLTRLDLYGCQFEVSS